MQSFLQAMQPLSLEIGTEREAVWYPSLVLDFQEGREVVVGVPTERGYEVRVEPGTVVRVQTAHPDGLRMFSCTVLRREAEPSPRLRLSWPSAVERVQRRDNVRVEVMVDVRLHLHLPEEDPRTLSGLTTDLSAGGMRILLGEVLPPGTELEIRLLVPGGDELECTGEVLRTGENPGGAPGRRTWAAVRFTGLSPVVERELTRFIFDIQRERLRRGVA